ncbi:hypothetical protein Ciccas_013399, partial [Cichlidogyrus casuarinus]
HVDNILALYDLDRQQHLVGLTTDNCAMMKLGQMAGIIHQGCIAHAIHLGFMDYFSPR